MSSPSITVSSNNSFIQTFNNVKEKVSGLLNGHKVQLISIDDSNTIDLAVKDQIKKGRLWLAAGVITIIAGAAIFVAITLLSPPLWVAIPLICISNGVGPIYAAKLGTKSGNCYKKAQELEKCKEQLRENTDFKTFADSLIANPNSKFTPELLIEAHDLFVKKQQTVTHMYTKIKRTILKEKELPPSQKEKLIDANFADQERMVVGGMIKMIETIEMIKSNEPEKLEEFLKELEVPEMEGIMEEWATLENLLEKEKSLKEELGKYIVV